MIGPRMTAEALRDACARLPRVALAELPTPIQHLPRLSERLGGPEIYTKRDDLTGLAFGGNKTRMFEFVLGRALEDGATAVVAGSAAQSNYARQLAAACARLGLRCHLVLRQVRGPADALDDGNLLLDRLLGAHVELMEDDRVRQLSRQLEVASALKADGHRVFLLPRASQAHYPLHSVAYVLAAAELDDQLAETDVTPTDIYVTTLDMTHAGLLLGLRLLGRAARLVAVSPFETALWPAERIQRDVSAIAGAASQLLGLNSAVRTSDVLPRIGYADAGYGSPTAADVAVIRLFAETEGLLLDPVYSCKAASALIDDISTGALTSNDRVIFWHTGGTPALFPYRTALDTGSLADASDQAVSAADPASVSYD